MYTNEEYDITIIEIKEKDKIENYLELDENIGEKSSLSYIGESIYILHYPKSKKIYVSYGIIKGENKKNKYKFNHLCRAEKGSSGSPILNISNNKLIGINKGVNREENVNIGLFIKYAIIAFNTFFNNKEKLKEFNRRFNTQLKDIKVAKLDLSKKWIGDEGLKCLCENINFKELKELNLSWNKISDIKILKKIKFKRLEKLDLSFNKISDNINFLENMYFKELKELYLSNNNISDIKVFEKVKFKALEKLDLSCNKISNNINILENVNFHELKVLNLSWNNISDIKVFEKVKFEKLEILNLSSNFKISDINILENVNFNELKELDLSSNNISDIKILEKIKFEKLELLDLKINKIDTNEFKSTINNLKSRYKLFDI